MSSDFLRFRVSKELLPPEGFCSEKLSPIESRANLWYNLILKGLDPFPRDKTLSGRIKKILADSPLCGSQLNQMRACVVLKVVFPSRKNVDRETNRTILRDFSGFEKGEFSETTLRKFLGNIPQGHDKETIASLLMLPTIHVADENSNIEKSSADSSENPSKPFSDRLEFFKKSKVLFDLALSDLPKEVNSSELIELVDQWFSIEKLYINLQDTKCPQAYFTLREEISKFSAKEYIDICNKLNVELGNRNYDKYAELVCAQNLLLAVADAFFSFAGNEVDLSCEFITALQDRTRVRSKYFTPLDVFRMWWSDVYLKSAYEKGRLINTEIAAICQVLRSAAQGKEFQNVLAGGLGLIGEKLKIIEEQNEVQYCPEPYRLMKKLVQQSKFPRLLLHWLDAPLLHLPKEDFGPEKESELFSELITQWNLRTRYCAKLHSKNAKEHPIDRRVANGDLSCMEIFSSADDIKENARRVTLYFQNEFTFVLAWTTAEQMASKFKLAQSQLFDGYVHYENARVLYLAPLYKYGKDLLKGRAGTFSEQLDREFSRDEFSRSIETIRLTRVQKRNLEQFASLLETPYFPYAIYQKMAQVLETFTSKSEKVHSLKELNKENDRDNLKFLERMEEFLPNLAFKPTISLEQLPLDIERFCKVLGIPKFNCPSKQLRLQCNFEMTENLRKEASIYFKEAISIEAKDLKAIKNKNLVELNIARKNIVNAVPFLIDEQEKLIHLLKEKTLTGPELGYLVFTTGKLVEFSMKLNLLKIHTTDPLFLNVVVDGRKILHSHSIDSIYSTFCEVMPELTEEEMKVLKSWNAYADYARYPKFKRGHLLDHYVLNGINEDEKDTLRSQLDYMLSISWKVLKKLNGVGSSS